MSSSVAEAPLVQKREEDLSIAALYRLSVEQYHRMIEVGILTDADAVELIEGCLVTKMSKNPPHSRARRLMLKALERLAGDGWFIDSQEAVTLETSEPEPDVVVARKDANDYADRFPGPEDLLLVVEVADSSLSRDRDSKKRSYARARVVTYWIVNLNDRQIEVYTEPSGPGDRPDYARRQDYPLTDEVPLVIEGREVGRVAVRDVLP